MHRLSLLVAESEDFAASAANLLRGSFEVRFADLDRDSLIDEVGPFDLLWVRLRHYIDKEVLNAGRQLKAIATNTTGLTHIDLEEADRQQVQVISLKGEEEFLRDIRATAEHTLGLTLALLRQTAAANQDVCRGNWQRDSFKGHEIYRKTVGIIGYGRLGKIAARYFKAFDAKVIIHSRDLIPGAEVDGFQVVSLSELLQQSDIVSLHVNYEPDNHHMIDRAAFEQMKHDALFVNTARGELVNEAALVETLSHSRIGGAALDVIESEHQRSTTFNQLVELAHNRKDVILTPHIGGLTYESNARTEMHLAQRLVRTFSEL